MPLYHVQDADRPLYVVAKDWATAIDAWRQQIREENDGDDGDEPLGVNLVCDDNELNIYGSPAQEVYTELRKLPFLLGVIEGLGRQRVRSPSPRGTKNTPRTVARPMPPTPAPPKPEPPPSIERKDDEAPPKRSET